MSETNHEIDSNFAGRLNILRAGVLGANDGIISIAGVVIGVASATSNIWIIFLSGFAAILAGAFSMAGGEYVSVSTQKDTEEAAVAREQVLLDQDRELAKKSLYAAYIQNGECETSAQLLTNKAFLNNPLKALVEEKYGIEYEEFTNPWHAAISSFISFFLGSLPPMLSVTIFPNDYRIPATVLIVGVALLLTGYTSAKLGKAPTKTAMIRNLAIGLLTMGVTFLLGQLFSISYSSKISSNHVSFALPYIWLLTSSVLSATSKQCFEQPAAIFLVCSLIFIEYKIQEIPRF